MPLYKAIEHGKEKRNPYFGAKAYFISCRNHGGKTKKREHGECLWCKGNRLHNSNVRIIAIKQQIKELEE